MKVLYILPYLPVPPNSGNKNLIFGLLKYINQSASFDIVLLVDPDDSIESKAEELIRHEFPRVGKVSVFAKPEGLGRLFHRTRYLFQGYHPALGNYENAEMRKYLRRMLQDSKYDVVHFDMFHTAIYLPSITKAARVLIASDAYSMAVANNRRLVKRVTSFIHLWIQELVLRRFEQRVYPRVDAVCSVSSVDADYLSRVCRISKVHNVGIALAQGYTERNISHFEELPGVEQDVKILVTGTLEHPVVAQGAIDFLERTLPILRGQYPSVKVTVLGRNARPELRACLASQKNVSYLEFVDDYPGFLDQDWVYVYPQRCGSGLQTKLQQAMALGLPVVGYRVSFGGMQISHGEQAFDCANEQQLERGLLELLDNRSARLRMGRAASEYARSTFSIERVGCMVMQVYQTAIKSARCAKDFGCADGVPLK
jgi:glycosyltransferase involved in cell wall biosynthesis